MGLSRVILSFMTEWTVPAVVERVVDGDTLELTLDLGWRVYMRASCRLLGVNAPELNTEAGRAARAYVEARCPQGARVRVVSKKLDKYGRPLVQVLISDDVYLVDLSTLLLRDGHAVPM